MTGMSTFHFLNQHPALYAVAGNMDDWELAGELPSQRTVELNGFTVGMVHGWGERSSVPERAAGLFQGRVDIVCYGHTHRRDFSPRGGMVLVNPGSLSLFDGPSFAILTLKEGRKPECEFVEP